MKKNIFKIILGLVFTALTADHVRADLVTNLEVVPFHVLYVAAPGCPGTNYGYAYLTNSAGTMWFKATNSTSATLTDLSGYAAPYNSAACVSRQIPGTKWCDSNTINFPVVSGNNYEFYIYVRSSGLTNGTPMTLQAVWQ